MKASEDLICLRRVIHKAVSYDDVSIHEHRGALCCFDVLLQQEGEKQFKVTVGDELFWVHKDIDGLWKYTRVKVFGFDLNEKANDQIEITLQGVYNGQIYTYTAEAFHEQKIMYTIDVANAYTRWLNFGI